MLKALLEKKIEKYQSLELLRTRNIIKAKMKNKIALNNSCLINFTSNDYLCLAADTRVCQKFKESVDQFGVGSSSSAHISGFCDPHKKLEEKFAEFVNREQALLFNSGYMANLGVITSLASRDTSIFSDKLCHASLLDAILLSRAKHVRYPHNHIDYLRDCFKKLSPTKNKFIVSESIFSMEGDIAKVKELVQVAKEMHAILLIDDAHALGVLGKQGGGICQEFSLTEADVPILISPLGKAFGGVGAIVSGCQELIEVLLQYARTYMYSTAMPPAIAQAMITSLDIIQNECWRREKLFHLIRFFNQQAIDRSLPLKVLEETPIRSIVIGSNKKAVNLQNYLRNKGFFVGAIRPPSVPHNTARIRISLNCFHEEVEILNLLNHVYAFLNANTAHD